METTHGKIIYMKKPSVCILKTDGTNCDAELFYAFEKFGARPQYVHINQLRNKEKKLKNFQILAFPGGFSYGDDIVSGKILATELTSFFSEELRKFTSRTDTVIIGICNGFQVLIRTGLLPFGHLGKMSATLTNNDSGKFECRWVKIKPEKSRCIFLSKEYDAGWTSVNHGEGKLYTDDKTLEVIEKQNLVVFRYCDEKGNATQEYPKNPNGSLNAIAGMCDPTGRILGLMPHPEKFVDITQYPNWRRDLPAGRQEKIIKPHGAFIFEEMIHFTKQS